MRTNVIVGFIGCLVAMILSGSVWALDEAVLTPTAERGAAGSSTAKMEKDKADAEKAFNAAMSVWYKHRYADGEKLLGAFAAKHPNSRWMRR
jgi:TolA-binding protein